MARTGARIARKPGGILVEERRPLDHLVINSWPQQVTNDACRIGQYHLGRLCTGELTPIETAGQKDIVGFQLGKQRF